MKVPQKVTRWQLSTANLSDNVLRYIEDAITNNSLGTVTLVAQDGFLVQVDIFEKIWVDGAEIQLPPYNPQAGGQPVRSKIFQAILGLQFGQVTILVNKGRITRIERDERTRWRRIYGLDGDGI